MTWIIQKVTVSDAHFTDRFAPIPIKHSKPSLYIYVPALLVPGIRRGLLILHRLRQGLGQFKQNRGMQNSIKPINFFFW